MDDAAVSGSVAGVRSAEESALMAAWLAASSPADFCVCSCWNCCFFHWSSSCFSRRHHGVSGHHHSERDGACHSPCCRGTAVKRSSYKDIHASDFLWHPSSLILLSASLRVWSSSISIQRPLTFSWPKLMDLQKVWGLTTSSFLISWDNREKEVVVVFLLPLPFVKH